MDIMRILKKQSWIMTILLIVISSISILTVYSNTFEAQNLLQGKGAFSKHILFILSGFIIYFIISLFDYRWLRYTILKYSYYLIAVIALIYIFFFGNEIAGVKRWIEVFNFQIQPSEFVKIVSLLITASGIFEIYKKLELINSDEYKALDFDTTYRNKFEYYKKTFIKHYPQFFEVIKIFVLNLILIVLIAIAPSFATASIVAIISITLYIFSYHNISKILNSTILFIISSLCIKNIYTIKIYSTISDINIPEILKNLLLAHVSNIYIFPILVILLLVIILLYKKYLGKVLIFLSIFCGIIMNIFFGFLIDSNIFPCYPKERIGIFILESGFYPEDKLTIKCKEKDIVLQKDSKAYNDKIYQKNLAISQIVSGGYNGKGYLLGTKRENAVPFLYTDFALSGFIEEFGSIGFSLLMIVYLSIISVMLYIITKVKDIFGKILGLGIIILLCLQLILAILINLGLFINTGIPMPFLSYGSSNLIMLFILFGLMQSIWVYGR